MSYFPGKLNINFQHFYISVTSKPYIATLVEEGDLLLTFIIVIFTAEFENNNKNVTKWFKLCEN